jgi:membrane-bound serine protease (ClpP class)
VKETLNLEGRVLIHGEIWKAESDTVISVGEKVLVEEVKGLKVKVRKISE